MHKHIMNKFRWFTIDFLSAVKLAISFRQDFHDLGKPRNISKFEYCDFQGGGKVEKND